MRVVWKYPVYPKDDLAITMPRGAEILCVQTQFNQPMIWALVNPEEPVEVRRFVVYGTGHYHVPDDPGKYIGTFQLEGGALVFHLFEVTNG